MDINDSCESNNLKLNRSKRLYAFDKLYNENKSLLHMEKKNNYPLNYKKGINWAQHHCDQDSVKFATSIIENTIYISFTEFLSQLHKVCSSFINFYKDKKDIKIILIIPYNMQKSNIWVSLLIYPLLRHIVYDVQYNLTNVYNEYIIAQKSHGVVCVVCDDCAYTGNQIMSYSRLEPSKTNFIDSMKEPSETSSEWLKWNTYVEERMRNLEKTITRDIFSVNLIIPYMSTLAQQNIIEHPFLMIPRDVKIFQLFRERINMHEYNQGIVREFESSFQYHSNISAIYFDHKIADAVSTFNKVFLLAPVFNCGNLRKSICFIENCNDRELPADFNIYDIYINVETSFNDICPPTFYKSIKYTFNNKSVVGKCVSEVIG